MKVKQILDQDILNSISKYFGLPAESITHNTVAQDVAGWDSFRHMDLILYLENEYNIEFSAGELAGMDNVGSLIRIIKEKC